MSIFSKLHVLVYDENIFMGRLLYTILSSFEIGQTTLCHDWSEVKYYIDKVKFDCVFCDFSGTINIEPKCLEKIRTSGDSADPSVPIVVCSGHLNINSVLTCRDLGCSEIISKPISPAHVFDNLYASIYNPRSFVALDKYTGPDRRRKGIDSFLGIERRLDKTLAQDEIDKLMAE